MPFFGSEVATRKMGETDGRQRPILSHREKDPSVDGGAFLAPCCHLRLLLSIKVAKVLVMAARLHERQMVHRGVKFIINHHQLSKMVKAMDISHPLT